MHKTTSEGKEYDLANSDCIPSHHTNLFWFPLCHLFHCTELLSRMYQCWLCHQFARKTLNGILRHIRGVHPHFEGRVMCGINGCPSTASTYKSLRQHLYKKNAAELKLELLSDHTPQLTIHDADEPPAND